MLLEPRGFLTLSGGREGRPLTALPDTHPADQGLSTWALVTSGSGEAFVGAGRGAVP